jgi:hypothetical protein
MQLQVTMQNCVVAMGIDLTESYFTDSHSNNVLGVPRIRLSTRNVQETVQVL